MPSFTAESSGGCAVRARRGGDRVEECTSKVLEERLEKDVRQLIEIA